MKRLIMVLAMVLMTTTPAQALDLTFTWDANTEPDLAGYKLHYGPAVGDYSTGTVDVGNVTTYTWTGLPDGADLHFAATAYDTFRNESGFSNDVWNDEEAPGSPGSFQKVP